MKLIKYHLASLTRFAGRDDRATFWPWVGVQLGLMTALWMAIFIPEFIKTFARMNAFAIAHPDQVTVTQGPGTYEMQIHGNHPELAPDFGFLMNGMSIILLLVTVMLAAAVVRRLHDSNRRGFWGLMPLPFLIFGFWKMGSLVTMRAEPDFSAIFLVFGSNLLYLLALGILVVLLVGKSTPGENRFGLEPVGR